MRRLRDFQLHPDTVTTYSNSCFADFKDDVESLSKIRISQNWTCCQGFLLIFENLFQSFGTNKIYFFLYQLCANQFCINSRTETETSHFEISRNRTLSTTAERQGRRVEGSYYVRDSAYAKDGATSVVCNM